MCPGSSSTPAAGPLSALAAARDGVLGFPPVSRPGSLRRRGPAGRAQVSQAPDEEAGGKAAPPQAQPAAPLRVPGDPGQGHLRQSEEGARELGAPGECSSLSRAGPGWRLEAGPAEVGPGASALLRGVAPFSLYHVEVASRGHCRYVCP